MGHLAFLGSRRVNGVSALHTSLMRQTVFRDLHSIYPDRIVNKTNGITFRRWLYQANPGLTELIVDAVGPQVLDDAGRLEALAPLADDAAFRERFEAVRRRNKIALARLVAERLNIGLDPDALFDVHIKRIHEYKRQLLNVLDTIALFNAMRAQPTLPWVPRVKIFAGKAAAGYQQAKLIIKLANDVAHIVNRDPVVRGRLKVVFLPNYNVSLAEAIIPAADLSEQISTAGMEASGTGNMKLALNGALTIGTLDGANIEILERVGPENIMIFGLTADEVAERRRAGIDATADHRRVARARARCWTPSRRACSPPTTGIATRASSTVCATTTTSWSTADFDAYHDDAARDRRALAGPRRVVAEGDSQHGADGLVLRGPGDPGICARNLACGAGSSLVVRRNARSPALRHDRRDRRRSSRRPVRGAGSARRRRRRWSCAPSFPAPRRSTR